MMNFFHAFILAVLQGLTEFLPVSSSAHLVLLPIIMQWQDQGVVIDIAAHFGSLLAVIFYFRKEVQQLIQAWFTSIFGTAGKTEDSLFAWKIIWASIPIVIVALIFQAYLLEYVRNAVVIGIGSIVFALLLLWADLAGKQNRKIKELSITDAILIGIAQAVALIPGASRSGTTITAAMMLGLNRVDAARFSFILAIPTILIATIYAIYKSSDSTVIIDWSLTISVIIVSAITAFLCIHWFLKLVTKIGMLPFVVYRILMGVILLIVFW